MLRVALTGGIGCGKSVVLAEFARLGVPCFEADREAAKLYDEPPFCSDVVKLLGKEVLDSAGGIDKKKVAAIVFADKEKLRALSALVHPIVMQRFSQWAARQDAPYAMCEVAVLYEYGLDEQFDKVVVVHLNLEERLNRLVLRDHCSREQLMARISNQLSADEKLMRADYVILNYEGNPRTRQVQTIDRKLRGKRWLLR